MWQAESEVVVFTDIKRFPQEQLGKSFLGNVHGNVTLMRDIVCIIVEDFEPVTYYLWPNHIINVFIRDMVLKDLFFY